MFGDVKEIDKPLSLPRRHSFGSSHNPPKQINQETRDKALRKSALNLGHTPFLISESLNTVGVCSSNSLATRRRTRNLIYILPLFFLIFLQLLLTQQVSRLYQLLYFYSTSIIVAVLIAKAIKDILNKDYYYLFI